MEQTKTLYHLSFFDLPEKVLPRRLTPGRSNLKECEDTERLCSAESIFDAIISGYFFVDPVEISTDLKLKIYETTVPTSRVYLPDDSELEDRYLNSEVWIIGDEDIPLRLVGEISCKRTLEDVVDGMGSVDLNIETIGPDQITLYGTIKLQPETNYIVSVLGSVTDREITTIFDNTNVEMIFQKGKLSYQNQDKIKKMIVNTVIGILDEKRPGTMFLPHAGLYETHFSYIGKDYVVICLLNCFWYIEAMLRTMGEAPKEKIVKVLTDAIYPVILENSGKSDLVILYRV